MNRIYVVMSPIQDEMTLQNRWFPTYEEAYAYWKNVNAFYRFSMILCAVEPGLTTESE